MLRRSLSLIALLAACAPAAARAEYRTVDFDVKNKVLAGGKEKPTLIVTANDDADGVVVDLKRDDGKTWTLRTGRLKANQVKKFVLDVPPGPERHFTGSMKVVAGNDVQTANFDFKAEIVVPAKIEVDPAQVDLPGRSLVLTSSRKTDRIEVEVTGDQGQPLGRGETSFESAPPGTPLKATWTQGEGRPLKITIRVRDPDDFYSGLELYPWRIDIPHEEVNFATGSFKIEKVEEFKLQGSLEQITDAVAKYGRFAQVKLYIAGHTDTVGANDSNKVLSLNRARSIAEYFRRQGLRIPVFYEGFGEEALKVRTADETDEVQNRRVEYTLAVTPPSQAGWKAVR